LSGFVRFESARADSARGLVGIFGLVDVLGRHGMLTAAEEAFRHDANAGLDAAYPDPCAIHPTTCAPEIHPGAAAWFRATATGLPARVPPYLAILDAHALAWRRRSNADAVARPRRSTAQPGRISTRTPSRLSPSPEGHRSPAPTLAGAHPRRRPPLAGA
jgi:hypothetical protein